MATEPFQVFSDALRHTIFTTIIPLGILAAFAGLLFKAFENWTVRKIRDWRRGRIAPKQIEASWQRPKSDDSDVPHCSVCNRMMVRRTARKGENIGSAFWGCSAFPK